MGERSLCNKIRLWGRRVIKKCFCDSAFVTTNLGSLAALSY